ncbi:MAG: hypothetical protein HY511_01230 [Actinobacteria bacterium]|nr:hypothetical protein [Actinomycetota bacterium]
MIRLSRSLLCRVLGHRLPRSKRPFFLTERFQRCERCGARVRAKYR